MNKIKKCYGICLQQCEILNRNSNKCEHLLKGDLIRILELNISPNGNDKVLVRPYNTDENTFTNHLFECAKQNIGYVDEALWLYLIGTKENDIRMQIYSERDHIIQLKCGREITLKSYENDPDANITGIVQLIDAVNEKGIGNFIGIKLLNPPDNRTTLFTLYKKHFDPTTSLLLFRIDQLLDAIKKPNQPKTFQTDLSPKLSSFETLNLGQSKMILNDKNLSSNIRESQYKVPVVSQQTIHTEPLISSLIPPISNTVVSPSVTQTIPIQETSDTNQLVPIPTTVSSSYASSMPRSMELPRDPPQRTLFDLLCDSNSPPRSIACWEMSKLNNESKNVISKPKGDNLSTENPISTAIKSFMSSFANENENSANTQLVNVSTDNIREMSKTNKSETSKKNNGRLNQTKRIVKHPNHKINFKSTKFHGRQNKGTRKPLHCHICHSLFGRDTLVLQCKHYICVKCFATKISSLIGTTRVRCPFVYDDDFACPYQLRRYELNQLRQKLDEFILVPQSNNRYGTRKDYAGDELFECKNMRCNGKWFISKADPANLFKCPLCKIINCSHCKVIHSNLTCTEYHNNIRTGSNALQNISGKLNNLILSNKQEGRNKSQHTDESDLDQIETLMKCKKDNCTGQWFVLKIDKNKLFKCPTCQLFNCTKCNAIHQNQSCEEYQKDKQTKFSSLKSRRVVYNQDKRNANVFENLAIKNLTKRKWSCTACTFENFSFGHICEICNSNNEN